METTLSAITVYPVKGLQGIAVDTALCTDRGLEHDRRFMVVDRDGAFLSQRSHPRMATVWTDLGDGVLTLSAPDAGGVDVPLQPQGAATMPVRVWRSTVDAVPASAAADAWLGDYLGTACRLVYMPESSVRLSSEEFAGPGKRVSFADGYAYLVIGQASLDDLNRRLAGKSHPPLPMNRFRPSLVVAGAAAFAEDHWGDVRIGEAVLRAAKPCERCEVTTTDQATGERRGPEPLATLSGYRNADGFRMTFGMNLVTVTPGRVRVGDRVEPA